MTLSCTILVRFFFNGFTEKLIMGTDDEKEDYFEHLDKKRYRKKYKKRVKFRKIKGVQ